MWQFGERPVSWDRYGDDIKCWVCNELYLWEFWNALQSLSAIGCKQQKKTDN